MPEAAGSNGKPDDREKEKGHDRAAQKVEKAADNEMNTQQQLQQLKKQHRLQLQERNRQICHLQEDREKLRRSLRQAETDVRYAAFASETVMALTLFSNHCCYI